MCLHRSDSAFARNEVITVAAIGFAMAGLILSAVQSAREAARRMQCSNNLKQVAIGLHNYHDVYNRFSSGWLATHPDDPSGAGSWGWSRMIIPFLE